MADLNLGPVVGVLVNKVIALATEQLGLAWGLKEDMKKFRLVMKMVRGVLHDADEKQVNNHSEDLRSWLEELRAVVDEADDVLEEMAYENLRQKVAARQPMWKSKVSYLSTQSNPVVSRLRIANRIKNLNVYLADINAWASQMGLQYKLAHTIVLGPRVGQTHSLLGTSEVIGRIGDVSGVVEMLTDPSSDQEKLSVISVVGMAGLGKTTLAKKVGESEKITSYFGKKMWVCVSENFEVNRILDEMLESLGGSTHGNRNRDTLLQGIRKELEKKGEKNETGSYLLILDDLWNEDSGKWEELRSCLLGVSTKLGNRVLVTTRSEKVARIMETRADHLHRLKELDDRQCWSIIKERAFGRNDSLTESFEEIGANIARNCRGIPLVANVIGGILCNKDITDWESFQKKIDEKGTFGDEHDARIQGILRLSYDRLPKLALKQCFAFCSVFPKDFVMERELLVQLWMAEGFIQPSKGCSMEDVGEKYFNDLLAYSLFQEEERDSFGSVKSCKLHDLIHDLAQSITEGETVIFDGGSRMAEVSDQVRHLNLVDGMPANLENIADQLRTLLIKGDCGHLNCSLANLRRLRVISFCRTYDEKLPPCFSKLKSLSFLDISRTRIKELPRAINKLYNLQTFRRRPKGIENLLSLRHLYFNQGELMPANLGRLTNLQTLPLFCVGKKKGLKIEELGTLSQLRGNLEIMGLEEVEGKSEAESAKLQDKAIEELTLRFYEGKERRCRDEDVLEGLRPPSVLKRLKIRGYEGGKLPSWVPELRNLVELKIIECQELKDIPRLQGFLSLRRVEIEDCNGLSRIDDGVFVSNTSLQVLVIYDCCNLERVSVDGLPSLQELSIQRCEKLCGIGESLSLSRCLEVLRLGPCEDLQCIPSLDGLTSLKRLYIRECDKLECLPSSLSSCNTLEIMEISACKNLSCIPSLDSFTSLKTLEIEDCDQLVGLPSGLSSCIALETLKIRSCKNLVFVPKDLEELHSLVDLNIAFCPNLRSNPPGPGGSQSQTSSDYLKQLSIYSDSEEGGEISFLSSIHHLPSIQVLYLASRRGAITPLPQHIQCYTALKELTINGLQVESLPLPPPHGLGKLSSLTKLEITNCNLISVPEGLKELRSLAELEISNCRGVKSFLAEETFFGSLTSLRSLTIGGCRQEEFPDLSSILLGASNLYELRLRDWESLTQLPDQNLHQQTSSSSMKKLSISGCTSLEALPEWLGNLSSLEHLVIEFCRNLKHLPSAEAIQCLSNLNHLEIFYCSELEKRCAEGSGSEWSKISHIQKIEINYNVIQYKEPNGGILATGER